MSCKIRNEVDAGLTSIVLLGNPSKMDAAAREVLRRVTGYRGTWFAQKGARNPLLASTAVAAVREIVDRFPEFSLHTVLKAVKDGLGADIDGFRVLVRVDSNVSMERYHEGRSAIYSTLKRNGFVPMVLACPDPQRKASPTQGGGAIPDETDEEMKGDSSGPEHFGAPTPSEVFGLLFGHSVGGQFVTRFAKAGCDAPPGAHEFDSGMSAGNASGRPCAPAQDGMDPEERKGASCDGAKLCNATWVVGFRTSKDAKRFIKRAKMRLRALTCRKIVQVSAEVAGGAPAVVVRQQRKPRPLDRKVLHAIQELAREHGVRCEE